MLKSPEWFSIDITLANNDNLPTGHVLKFETPAGDEAGAEWLANDALIHLAQSKDIPPAKLTSAVTPCKDC